MVPFESVGRFLIRIPWQYGCIFSRFDIVHERDSTRQAPHDDLFIIIAQQKAVKRNSVFVNM